MDITRSIVRTPVITTTVLALFLAACGGSDDPPPAQPPPTGVENVLPIAIAGLDLALRENEAGALNASDSSDSDGTIANYAWSVVGDTALVIDNADKAEAAFTAPVVDTDTAVAIRLEVTDNKGGKASDELELLVFHHIEGNNPPQPVIQPVPDSVPGSVISLDASESIDTDGSITAYAWSQLAGPVVELFGADTPVASFHAPADTALASFKTSTGTNGAAEDLFVFRLIVTDSAGERSAVNVPVTVKPLGDQLPTANAGADQTVNAGDIVTLNGNASSDAETTGDALGFTWIQTNIDDTFAVTLDDAASATPTFTLPADIAQETVLVFELTITDSAQQTAIDTVAVTVIPIVEDNLPPVAVATGPAEPVGESVSVTLDGSASHDLDGTIASYQWTQIGTPAVIMENAGSAEATFTTPVVAQDTTLTFRLTVTDDRGTVDSTDVSIFVIDANNPPVAIARANGSTANIEVLEGANITLDGRDSSDPDDDALTHIWTADGITLNINPDNAALANAVAPSVDIDTEFTVTLTVNDGTDLHEDHITILVKANRAPIANAGPDQTVDEGTAVSLSGAASSDPDEQALTFEWMQTAGQPVTLSGSGATRSFTAPEGDTTLTFQVTAIDTMNASATDTVDVVVRNIVAPNQPPTANAGADQTVDEGGQVTLDGSASQDPENVALRFAWQAPAGITLSSTTAANPTFTAPDVSVNTSFVFALTVTDSGNATSTDTVRIDVHFVNQSPTADAGADVEMDENTSLQLQGSGSDPDGGAVRFEWIAPAGFVLDDVTIPQPTITATPEVAATTDFTFTLNVFDAQDGSISASDQTTVKVHFVNQQPVADAGAEMVEMDEHTTLQLLGSGSDPDGGAVRFEWVAPAGFVLDEVTLAQPTITATPEVTATTDFTFTLNVFDAQDDTVSASDQVTVRVHFINQQAVADAGAGMVEMDEHTTLQLLGSGSDPDGGAVRFEWIAPAGFVLDDVTIPQPTITATPEVAATTDFAFTLNVFDAQDDTVSASDQVTVKVHFVNQLPTADAGAEMVEMDEHTTLQLLGSGSDPDGGQVRFEWIAPPDFVLDDATLAQPTITATPEVTVTTDFVFTLNVFDAQDGSISTSDQAIVKVRFANQLPTADAGAEIVEMDEHTTLQLLGSGSDPDGGAVRFEWIAPADFVLDDVTIPQPTITATPEVTTTTEFTFTLNVFDAQDDTISQSDEVVVMVNHVEVAPSVVITPSGYDGLNKQEPITMLFDRSMSVDTVALDGSLVDHADIINLEWSQTEVPDDTLTIHPLAEWPRGVGQTISVSGIALDDAELEETVAVIYVPLEFVSGQAASVVIGQANFTNAGANHHTNETPSQRGMYSPSGNMATDGVGVYIGDRGNNRVLYFAEVPEAGAFSANAAGVIGQDAFNVKVEGNGLDQMIFPHGVAFHEGALYVADTDNNRVLYFETAPTGIGAVADAIIVGDGSEGCSANQLNFPMEVSFGGGRMLVTDKLNSRVLVWNTVPREPTPPDMVIGQTAFDQCLPDGGAGTTSGAGLSGPGGAWTDGERLLILDSSNHRLLIWDVFPTSGDQEADHVLGQPDLTSDGSNGGLGAGVATGGTFYRPVAGLYSNGEQIIVADNSNGRVLVWNSWPVSDFQEADVVLGKPNLTTVKAGTYTFEPATAAIMTSPAGITVVGDKVLINDTLHSRVMVFQSQ